MMSLTWYGLGVLSGASAIFLKKLSERYRLNPMAWSGLILGIFLILFSIAWAVGSVLEGVPRAAGMGVLLFGMSGIVLLTFTTKYISAKIERISPLKESPAPVEGETEQAPEMTEALSGIPTKSEAVSKVSASVSAGLKWAAYISLILAFIYGKATDTTDYESMVKLKFPDQQLTQVNDDPVVFQLGEKKDGTGNYILIREGQGYGGPFVIGVRIMDDAKIHEVMLLDDRETPAFIKMTKDAGFANQFIGRHVADDFIVGVDVNAVSGATISTMAGTEAIRKGAHMAATQYFKLEPKWKKVPWKIGIGEILIMTIFILAFFPKIYKKSPWNYAYIAASIAIVGFYLNAAISVGSLSGLAMGYVPGIQDHLIWWILVVGSVAAIVLLGKNVYCYRVCPFYGVQYLLNKISGTRLKLPATLQRQTQRVANVLVWLSLMTIFLSSHPALGAYEPFAMMFSLNGIGVQWYILPLALIGSFFMSSYWCRFFCPAGHTFTHMLRLRRKLTGVFQKNKTEKENNDDDR